MTLLYDLIEQDFGISGRGRWFHADTHDSLVYDAEKDIFFWNSREVIGDAIEYLTKIRGMKKDQAKDFLKSAVPYSREYVSSTENQEPYIKLVRAFWANGLDDRKYWYDRKLTDETINRRSLGYYEGWYMVPLYKCGDLANFQMRRDEPEKSIRLWYRIPNWKPILYNCEVLEFVNKVYIVEGLIDCILLSQEGLPCVCSTGGAGYWGDEWFTDFHKVDSIYYIADNDKAGMLAANKVATSLGQNRVKIYNFDGKPDKYDTVDFFRDGGNVKELAELVEKDSKYSFETGVSNGNTKRKSYRVATASYRRY